MSDLKHRDIWTGEYRDIKFEINRFDSYDKEAFEYGWTFYLYLMLEVFPEERRESMRSKIYYTQFGMPLEVARDNPVEKIDWHGGMTWISEETRKGYPFTLVKYGCDYQHLWDENKCYTIEEVHADVKKCIDSLYEYMPPTKTAKKIWDEFRGKFPGEKAGDQRTFDINAQPIEI